LHCDGRNDNRTLETVWIRCSSWKRRTNGRCFERVKRSYCQREERSEGKEVEDVLWRRLRPF